MNTERKGELIGNIIALLRMEAERASKPFDEGDIFFALAFRDDDELLKIARLIGA